MTGSMCTAIADWPRYYISARLLVSGSYRTIHKYSSTQANITPGWFASGSFVRTISSDACWRYVP
eukprot:6791959-Alexandrium_andersonii.AAC.1